MLVAEEAQGYLFLVTEQGMVKRVALADFVAAAPRDPVVMNVDEKDRLRWVVHTQGEQEVILVIGQRAVDSLSVKKTVRSMGLAAGGVGGMKLKKGDVVVYAGVVEPAGELMTMTEQGYAKRTRLGSVQQPGTLRRRHRYT